MIKLENFEVVGWEHAIRGMRNPMNSWDKSDSGLYPIGEHGVGIEIGDNDHNLMMKLRNAGTDHRKFMRMIDVYVDITAPLYWWKEFDTYKVGTVANSCSTMHKIHAKEFTLEDFSHEHLIGEGITPDHTNENPYDIMSYYVIGCLNHMREAYLETKDKKYWWQMIQLLPTSYNQKRTVKLNYEVLANIYKSRKNHKLDEWVEFCKWIESLPYSELIVGPALSDIPISNEIMDEAIRRVQANVAKNYEAWCKAMGVDPSKSLTEDQLKFIGVDLANGTDMTAEVNK